jgi:hypothetical protein
VVLRQVTEEVEPAGPVDQGDHRGAASPADDQIAFSWPASLRSEAVSGRVVMRLKVPSGLALPAWAPPRRRCLRQHRPRCTWVCRPAARTPAAVSAGPLVDGLVAPASPRPRVPERSSPASPGPRGAARCERGVGKEPRLLPPPSAPACPALGGGGPVAVTSAVARNVPADA